MLIKGNLDINIWRITDIKCSHGRRQFEILENFQPSNVYFIEQNKLINVRHFPVFLFRSGNLWIGILLFKRLERKGYLRICDFSNTLFFSRH